LKQINYKIYRASTGRDAILLAKEIKPDLILLDIILPDLNGYEVCREIKLDPVLNATPVLFLSSLDNVADKVLGFEAGGVDFISKPCQREELLARVKTHIDLFCIRKENERFANKMELLAQQRAASLVHAERLATLGTLSAGCCS
jgi:DNA-binding response OmpR family regulator